MTINFSLQEYIFKGKRPRRLTYSMLMITRRKRSVNLAQDKRQTRSTKGVGLKLENNEKIMNNEMIATGSYFTHNSTSLRGHFRVYTLRQNSNIGGNQHPAEPARVRTGITLKKQESLNCRIFRRVMRETRRWSFYEGLFACSTGCILHVGIAILRATTPRMSQKGKHWKLRHFFGKLKLQYFQQGTARNQWLEF